MCALFGYPRCRETRIEVVGGHHHAARRGCLPGLGKDRLPIRLLAARSADEYDVAAYSFVARERRPQLRSKSTLARPRRTLDDDHSLFSSAGFVQHPIGGRETKR